jgi:hypothetical protein
LANSPAEPRVVVDADPERAGRAVRALLEDGERVVGFVGDADDPACAEFVADVVRPSPPG